MNVPAKKIKITAVTGIRSDYDLMSTVYDAIEAHDELELDFIVTGAHLSKTFGHTIDVIRKDGRNIRAEIQNLIESDDDHARVRGLGIQITKLAEELSTNRPNILLVLGDREESMSTALVGQYMNIIVAHVAGGDRVVGNVDDQIRHAVSKMAHLHFTFSEKSAERLVKMGEEPFRVFCSGNPGLDRIRLEPTINRSDLFDSLEFDVSEDEPVIVFLQHVISTEIDQATFQIENSLAALEATKIKTVIIYPNSDPGSQDIIKVLKNHENSPQFKLVKNLERARFVNLLRHADALIGNSSCGILEAPFLKLPVVNIGNRQKGRQHADNVIFVDHDPTIIAAAIKTAVNDKNFHQKCQNIVSPFGDGHAAEKIANQLASSAKDPKIPIKDLTY